MLRKYLWIFFISMVPLIELRGAIPYAKFMNMPMLNAYIVAIIGNTGSEQCSDYAGATAIALVMLIIAFVVLFLMNLVQSSAARRAGAR